MEKTLKGTKSVWKGLPTPALNVVSPYIGMPVGAKTKHPKTGEAVSNNLKSISGGKVLSLTDYTVKS